MERIVKILFALAVGIIMFVGALMIYAGAREYAALPEAVGDSVIAIIGGADGPTSILIGGKTL